MKYLDFKKKISGVPFFSSSLLAHLGENPQVLRNQLSRWEKQNLLHKLRKGLYVLNEVDRKETLSRTFLANQIYSPSYVSTEFALGFYNLIPERVADVTSVTTRKTYRVSNIFGIFVYQHISEKTFAGFTVLQDEARHPFLIALPEKAMVDFIYLNLKRFAPGDMDVFENSFRFQNLGDLKEKRLLDYARLFKNKKLFSIVETLLDVREKQQ
jgi:predicted transcriptional regulator of viral defense system